MICHGCDLTSICKVFEMATSMSPAIKIVVHDCYLCSNNKVAAISSQAANVSQPEVRPQRTLADISEKIKEITKPVVADKLDETVKSDDAYVECSSCKTKIFEAEAIKCSACGIIICEGCATHDMGTKKAYCESCWDDIPAVPLQD